MEPNVQLTNLPDWRLATFGATGVIKFSMHRHSGLVPSELKAVTVLANNVHPWLTRDRYPAYLNYHETEMVLRDTEVVVYQVRVQPALLLFPNQLAAFTKHLLMMAATAPKFLSRPEALIWSGSEATYRQQTLVCYNTSSPEGV